MHFYVHFRLFPKLACKDTAIFSYMQIFFTFIFHFPLPPPIIATSRRPTTLLLTPQPHFSSTTNQTPPQPPTKLLFNHQPNFSPTTNQTPPQPPTTLLFNHQPHFSSTTNYTPPLKKNIPPCCHLLAIFPPTLCQYSANALPLFLPYHYRVTTVLLLCQQLPACHLNTF